MFHAESNTNVHHYQRRQCMPVHGFVERLVQQIGLPMPVISDAQRKRQGIFKAGGPVVS